MQEFDRLGKAFADFAAAALEMALALGECVAAALSAFPTEKIVAVYAAYAAAGNEHPEWVHRATYSKKKRIRKKYRDRIMRQYGRAER